MAGPTALDEQLGKLSPSGPGMRLYQRVAGEQAAATQPATFATGAAAGGDPFSVSGIDARNAEAAAEQARLEAEHSRLATLGTQAARGALDFVMAPAALIGAAAEGVGTVTGWDGLRDFGRDYGEAAQGSEAMATLFNRSGYEAVKGSVGLGAQNSREIAETAYNRTRNDIAAQQQAWPLLSTVSHTAGMVAAGLGVGSLAGAGTAAGEGALAQGGSALSRVGNAAAIGGYEGSASGAQAAYAENRPYRDVLGSTIMGGLMGAATAGGLQGAAEGFRSEAFSSYLKGFAKERTAKAIGLTGPEVRGVGGKEEALRLADDVANHVLEDGEGVFPKSLLKAGTISQDTVAERIAQGKVELGEKIGDMRRAVSEYVDANAPGLRPSVPDLIGKIRKEALDDLEKSPILASRGNDIKRVIEEIESKTVRNKLTSGTVKNPAALDLSTGSKVDTDEIGSLFGIKPEDLKFAEPMVDSPIGPSGQILTSHLKDGTRINASVKNFGSGPVVEIHDFDAGRMGEGLGSKHLSNMLDSLESNGVKRVDLRSTDVGRYYWAKKGFPLRPGEFEKVRDEFLESLSSSERLGTSSPTSIQDIASTQAGKRFLLSDKSPNLNYSVEVGSPEWRAIRQNLPPPAPVAAVKRSIVETSAGTDISLNDLRKIQENLKAKLYTKVIGAVPEAKAELQKVERIIEDAIEQTVDNAVPKMGTAEAGAYRSLRRLNQSFIQADHIAQKAVSRQLGNRGVSLTDTLAGTAAVAGDIASGGMGVVSMLKGMGASAIHKFAREHGSAFLAALSNKLAAQSDAVGGRIASGIEKLSEGAMDSESEWLGVNAHDAAVTGAPIFVGGLFGGGSRSALQDHQLVSVDAAGGREAQTVIAHLERARRSVADSVEAAGDNPTQRQLAQQAAMQTIAAQIAGKAGPFDPKNWASKAPNPLQKVLHRGAILDQISQDLANDTAHAASLKPSPDFDLNPDRVKKLTRDANGPLAIGGVQQVARDIARNAPPTPTGDQIRMAARAALQRLQSSDVPDAMTTGHELARQLSGLSDGAVDQITKDYVAREVTTIAGQLSAPAFGKAGELYSRLTSPPDPGYQQLLDPTALRAALSKADSTGVLPGALKLLATAVLDAHDAKKQFGGGAADREVAKQLKAIEDKFDKAEKAVTLDGGPAGRVLDYFTGKPGADATGLRGAPELTVLNTMRPQMERLLPVLGKREERYTGGGYRTPIPSLPKSNGELQSLYSERMQTLSQNVASPDPESIAASLKGLPNVPPSVQVAIGSDAQERMARLLQDMPKPTANVRGKAYETLSSDDLRKANAMWEATVKPMSVFSDFHSGTIDYDKAQYAWKQYPGLQQAAQAGLMDALHSHLDDDERANIPDSTLTQLDYLLGFNGTLQTSVDRGFSSRMTAMGQAESQKKPQHNGPLELSTSKPTFTERIAQGRG